VWVVWSPTGENKTGKTRLKLPAAKIEKAEKMPLAAGAAQPAIWKSVGSGDIEVEYSESPVYLWLKP
jgi:hypothetical protein